MSTPVLDVDGVSREFGDRTAVDNVSLSIDAGEIVGLLGPNGAGKTTTVRMCATLLTPTSGGLVVDGIDAVAQPHEARRRTGLVLGGDRGFYTRSTARRNLLFFADVAGVPNQLRQTRVDEALEAVDLSDRANATVGELSRGMRQRLHLARSLLTAPRLLLLDEPTSGLDPEIAGDTRRMIKQLADSGTAVLLTSHYLAEVEQLADTVVVLSEGRVLAEGSINEVAALSGVTSVTSFSLPEDANSLRTVIDDSVADVVDIEARGGLWHVRIPWRGNPEPALLDVLWDQLDIDRPIDLVTRPATLEESYLALLGGVRH